MKSETPAQSQIRLYPLRFVPIYHYRVWGGTWLSRQPNAPSSEEDLVGEAWLLSDRKDHPSVVAEGPLRGWTIKDLMGKAAEQLLGSQAQQFTRFPLLLKFLNARNPLSIQVHPSDEQTDYLPPGESGKTEAWVVLSVGTESRIYSGLKRGTTADALRKAIATETVTEHLVSITPKVGDCVLIPAGTVHSLGGDIVVFEIQENSDVTFRLYDWNRLDPKTGKPRDLKVEQALACINFAEPSVGVVDPVIEVATPFLRERLISCEDFGVWRIRGDSVFPVGAPDKARVLVLISGGGEVEHGGKSYVVKQDEVLLLPAVIGTCLFRPSDSATLLEIELPESNLSP